MMKRLNIMGIAILISALLAVQLAVGLVISPLFTQAAVEAMNASAGTKVTVETVRVWPVTLGFSLKGLKVFDPEDPSKQIIEIKSASLRISPWALLCKRLVFAVVKADGVTIDLEGQPDGSFNIQKLSKAGGAEKPGVVSTIWGKITGGKDWFSRIYDIIKKKSSKEGVERSKAEKSEGNKIVKDVQELPKGKRVEFKTIRDYLFEIKELSLRDVRLHLVDRGGTADIERAAVNVSGFKFDPDKGALFRSVSAKGRVLKDGNLAGELRIEYSSVFKGDKQVTDLEFVSKDLDLAAVKFIYDDSLPVDVVKGRLDMNSKTSIRGEAIDSRNKMVLKDHQLAGKMGKQLSAGAIAGPVIIEALNGVDPVKLDFDITGTLEKPEFGGFQRSLNEVIKPYMEKMGENIQKQGTNALQNIFKKTGGDTSTETGTSSAGGQNETVQKAVESVKSLFSGKTQEGK